MVDSLVKKQVIQPLKKFIEKFIQQEKNASDVTVTSSGDIYTIKRQDSFPSTSISEGTPVQNVRSSGYKVTFKSCPTRLSISELLLSGDFETAKELLKNDPKMIEVLLFEACYSNNVEILSILLDPSKLKEHAVDAACLNSYGKTALHIAAAEGYLEICECLIENLYSVDLRDCDSKTPLHHACISKEATVAQVLIRAGAQVNTQDKFGNTPLHYACIASSQLCIEILLENHADLRICNWEGRTPDQLRNNFLSIGSDSEDVYTVHTPNAKNYSHMIEDTNKYILSIFTPLRLTPQDFEPLMLLGRGSFGEVYLVKYLQTQEEFAMKILAKNRIIAERLMKYAVTERNVMSTIKHPFIVSLKYAFQTVSKLYMIEDYCPGGTLKNVLVKKRTLDEDLARIYICEIILGLEELHKNGIIYRDLKPENVAITADGHIKLIDFGLSKDQIGEKNSAFSFCGSVSYLAPEMLKRTGHGKAVDWYLVGVVLYEMLTGKVPFFCMSNERMFERILNTKVKIPEFFSSACKNLVLRLLEKNPELRLGSENGAVDIKNHAFFKGICWDNVLRKTLTPPLPECAKRSSENIPASAIMDHSSEDFPNIQGWTFVCPSNE